MPLSHRLLAVICYAFCGFGVVLATTPDGRRASAATTANFRNSYIIELKPGTSITSRDTSTVHQDFHKRASTLVDYKVRHDFQDPTYFFGVSIDVHSDSVVNDLLSLPEVKTIYQNRAVERPTPFKSKVANATSSASKEPTNKLNGTIPHITGTSDILSALKMTGVDKLHDLEIKGRGVKIGVIDTGIDYRHPALGGGFGKGFKIAGGYDFVGDNYTGFFDSPPPSPGPDPLATCIDGGHGTHVSGIIGAQDPDGVGFGIVGVAPEASIYMYRILGCEGTTYDDTIIQAFVKAGKDGVHAISMSVGGSNPWETVSPYTTTFAALHRQGVALILSNGNDGELGPYNANAPSSQPGAIAVGSVSNTKFQTMYNAVDSTGQTVEYARLIPISDPGEFNVFIVPVNKTSWLCDFDASFMEANATFRDGSHVIALMLDFSWCYGEVSFLLRKYEIKNIWFYMDEVADVEPELISYTPGFNIVTVRPVNAAKMISGIATQGTAYKLTFKDNTVHDVDQPTGRTMSFFSEIGPTVEMSLKPQLSAPGGYILSTWPLSGASIGYEILSGTSMAAPYVAGAYALIRSVHSSFSPTDILQMLQNTATPLPIYGSGILSTSLQQGAGLINVFEAMQGESRISPSELNLRDSAPPAIQKITIKNKSRLPKTYTIGHQGAAQIDAAPNIYETIPYSPSQLFDWSPNNNPLYATAKFSANSLTVEPSSSVTFTLQIIPPILDPNKLPLYSGYITIQESNNSYVIPYAGVPYHRADYQTLDTTNLINSTLTPLPPAGVPIVPLVYNIRTQVRDNDIAIFDLDNSPTISFDTRQPSEYIRVDAVPVNTSFAPDTYGFDRNVKPATIDPNITTFADISGTQTYGLINAILGPNITELDGRFVRPAYTVIGSYHVYWDWATLQLPNGSLYQVPNADYRILIRALKWGAKYTDAKGYESWLSPIVRLNISDLAGPNPCLVLDPDNPFACGGGGFSFKGTAR